MAKTYANATVTIAASAASNSSQGLFRIADGSHLSQAVSDTSGIYTREPLRHLSAELPLLNRGWVFQERLLSPRVVHFAENELIWECMECDDCECGAMNDGHDAWLASKSDSYLVQLHMIKNDHLELLRTWSKLINSYSSLKLSKPSDIFPAISGIAKSFGRATGWEYIAGIWKETMPRGLLWYADWPSRRRHPWQAPTFSWASVHSNAIHAVDDDAMTVLVTVIEAKTQPIGEDSTGQLKSGHIVLSGTIVLATLRHAQHGESDFEVETFPKDGEDAVRLRLLEDDFELMQSGYQVQDGVTIFCLKMCWIGPPNEGYARSSMYLVLSRRDASSWEARGMEGEHVYERIGICWDRDIAHRPTRLSFEDSSPSKAVWHNAVLKIV